MGESVAPNLLVAIRRNATCEEENLTTEAFANLLRQFFQSDCDSALAVLAVLTGGSVDFEGTDCTSLSATTQVLATPQSTPDLVIRAPGKMIVVEAKVDADLGKEQLPRYRKWVDSREVPQSCLVFLTKGPLDKKARCQMEKSSAVHVRWHEIARCLGELKKRGTLEQPTRYLTDQFVEFLTERRMTLQKVTWELAVGLRSLLDLMEMVNDAIPRLEDDIENVCALQDTRANGYSLKVGETKCWVGVRYEDANRLFFVAQKIDKDRGATAGAGVVREAGKGASNWENELELSSEDVHFFARDAASQADCIKHFIRQSVEAIRNITTREVRPIRG